MWSSVPLKVSRVSLIYYDPGSANRWKAITWSNSLEVCLQVLGASGAFQILLEATVSGTCCVLNSSEDVATRNFSTGSRLIMVSNMTDATKLTLSGEFLASDEKECDWD